MVAIDPPLAISGGKTCFSSRARSWYSSPKLRNKAAVSPSTPSGTSLFATAIREAASEYTRRARLGRADAHADRGGSQDCDPLTTIYVVRHGILLAGDQVNDNFARVTH